MKTDLIDDIALYEENVFAGLSLRQAVLSVLGVVLVAIAYFMTYRDMNAQAASYIAIGLGLPCFLFAFLRPRGMKLEKYAAVWLCFNFLSKQKRVWKSDNLFYRILWTEGVSEFKTDVTIYTDGAVLTVYAITKEKGKYVEREVFSGVSDAGGAVHIPDIPAGLYKWLDGGGGVGLFKVNATGRVAGDLHVQNRRKNRVETKSKKRPDNNCIAVKDSAGNVIGFAKKDKSGAYIMTQATKGKGLYE